MTSPVSLSMTGDQHDRLKQFLFPADGKEAVAIALCGRRDGDRRHRLVVRTIEEIPYNACKRTPMQITWPPDLVATAPSTNGYRSSRFTAIPAAMPPSPGPTTKGIRNFFP